MTHPHPKPTIFYTGRFSYRSSRTAKIIIGSAIVSAVGLALGVRHLQATGLSDPSPLGIIACLIGIVAFAIAAARLWGYARGTVEELHINGHTVQLVGLRCTLQRHQDAPRLHRLLQGSPDDQFNCCSTIPPI